ncbi:sulfite exporter TauE/SafE family protein [Actinoallomurus rhizosphaericola]|uniref:sulfite exporter TauE/SafE family protein n=1 Tax=Actinoallomurus rhizosphaericola TaxID=2952536 RepID=UPI002090946D|nr:sulfite exporter TauE/SafE family protein [Actinoallomurus rhizosphaericola]MCO5992781.1 sulfite exporter TauE/SafE family protein [Actinoallomurus rhizosphaericola]
MHFDYQMAMGSFLVAIVVGLTGMGGGALMTPMLTVFFGVPPLTAVSSDLVAAAVMKPVGSLVHLRRGTVNLRLVAWLCAGSVPTAFCGVLLARALGHGSRVQDVIEIALGVALLIAASGLVIRSYLTMAAGGPRRAARASSPDDGASSAPVSVRPIPTMLVGAVGGLVVGMTSVGSGSLIVVALLALYPKLTANRLVGTDLLQAVPLVWSAALGHILFGDFKLSVTLALLAGSIPGVILGSLASSRAPGGLIRWALAFVLLASALKMFNVGTTPMAWALVAAAVGGTAAWSLLRAWNGLRPLPLPRADAPPPRTVPVRRPEKDPSVVPH